MPEERMWSYSGPFMGGVLMEKPQWVVPSWYESAGSWGCPWVFSKPMVLQKYEDVLHDITKKTDF